MCENHVNKLIGAETGQKIIRLYQYLQLGNKWRKREAFVRGSFHSRFAPRSAADIA